MIPEPRNCLLRDLRVLKAVSIVVEYGKFVSTHNVGRRLCLNSAPNLRNSLFKDRRDGWVDLAFLVVSHYLKRSSYRELTCAGSFSSRLTHVASRIVRVMFKGLETRRWMMETWYQIGNLEYTNKLLESKGERQRVVNI